MEFLTITHEVVFWLPWAHMHTLEIAHINKHLHIQIDKFISKKLFQYAIIQEYGEITLVLTGMFQAYCEYLIELKCAICPTIKKEQS